MPLQCPGAPSRSSKCWYVRCKYVNLKAEVLGFWWLPQPVEWAACSATDSAASLSQWSATDALWLLAASCQYNSTTIVAQI